MSRVFISYARKDKEIVNEIRKEVLRSLQESYENVADDFFWIDVERILPGMSLNEGLFVGVNDADYLMVFFSESYSESRFCMQELESFVKKENGIIDNIFFIKVASAEKLNDEIVHILSDSIYSNFTKEVEGEIIPIPTREYVFTQEIRRLVKAFEEKEVIHKVDNSFPFTNREFELDQVINSKEPFHIITAPAGYGKTEFLKRVYNLLLEKNEGATYFSEINAYDCAQERVEHINGKLLDRNVSIGFEEFFDDVKSRIELNKEKKLTIILDLDKEYDPDLPRKIMDNYVRRIRVNSFFQILNIPWKEFKLIISFSGPNQDDYKQNVSSLGYLPHFLSEFNYEIIKKSLIKYWSGEVDSDIISSICARITLISGGYPTGVKKLAEEFREFNFSVIDRYAAQYSNVVVGLNDGYDLFKNSLDSRVYRYISFDTLAELTGKTKVRSKNLLESLDDHNIYTFCDYNNDSEGKNMFRKSNLLRRIYAVEYSLRDYVKFELSCNGAAEYYYGLLKNNYLSGGHTSDWLIEYWYSHLQKKLIGLGSNNCRCYDVCESKDRSLRCSRDLDLSLNTEMLTTSLNVFQDNCSDFTDFIKRKNDLLKKLSTDWEFQLLYNFSPSKSYSSDSYLEGRYSGFLDTLDDFFRSAESNF